MQKNYSDFQIPSFARSEAYDFGARRADESFGLYRELSQIAEEIEACRRRNF